MKKLTFLIIAMTAITFSCDQNLLTRLDLILNEFKVSEGYEKLLDKGYSFDLNEAQIVYDKEGNEFLNFPIYEYKIETKKQDKKLLRKETTTNVYESEYFSETDFSSNTTYYWITTVDGYYVDSDEDTFSGSVYLDFYNDNNIGEATYSGGEFVGYYIDNNLIYGESGAGARIYTVEYVECQSACHVLKCTGKKYEDQGIIEKTACTLIIAKMFGS